MIDYKKAAEERFASSGWRNESVASIARLAAQIEGTIAATILEAKTRIFCGSIDGIKCLSIGNGYNAIVLKRYPNNFNPVEQPFDYHEAACHLQGIDEGVLQHFLSEYKRGAIIDDSKYNIEALISIKGLWQFSKLPML